METRTYYDVIIVGGSYSGLAAAMSLGRSFRHVLIIDSGKPCNSQTPHSHNFITQDGKTPAEIMALAKRQVEAYKTVNFFQGLAMSARRIEKGFEVATSSGEIFRANKLIFATGIKDILPAIDGFAECFGISILHCPYCHGYEVANRKTGILGNGDSGVEFAGLISNWTPDLTLYTNGKSSLTEEQTAKLESHNIKIVEKPIASFNHTNGYVKEINFEDGSKAAIEALYSRNPFEQHCSIPQSLGCEVTEDGYIKVDAVQKTTVDGVFACGDNSSRMRSLASAVAAGTAAGAMVNRELIFESF